MAFGVLIGVWYNEFLQFEGWARKMAAACDGRHGRGSGSRAYQCVVDIVPSEMYATNVGLPIAALGLYRHGDLIPKGFAGVMCKHDAHAWHALVESESVDTGVLVQDKTLKSQIVLTESLQIPVPALQRWATRWD